MNTITVTDKTTLGELLILLDLADKSGKTPTPRELFETAGDPIAETNDCTLFRNGFAIYKNMTGRTVVWLPYCVSFTYYFNKLRDSEKDTLSETYELPEGFLEGQPWIIAVTLIGDHRIEANSMNRTGSRKDTVDLASKDNGDKDDTQTAVFKQPGLIPINKLAEILPTLNRISSWIEAVFAFVSSEAINHGVPIPGYKVVEGRSKRVFTDTKAVVDVAVQNGYTDLYKQTLITLTEFEKMMGKKKFNELLGEYVAKPPGKLALVPESDPREPVDLTTPGREFSALPDEE